MKLEQKLISEKAYELWETSGKPEGRDEEFWLDAEKAVIPFCPIHNTKMVFMETYFESSGTCDNYWTCWQDCDPVDTSDGKISYRCFHTMSGKPYQYYCSENRAFLSIRAWPWCAPAVPSGITISNLNSLQMPTMKIDIERTISDFLDSKLALRSAGIVK